MKILKKVLTALLAASFVVFCLPGCSVSSVSGSLELPADGIVKQSVFRDAEKDSRMLTFRGKSGGFAYSWFFDGASITAPADQNLKVDFSDAGGGLNGAVSSSELVKIHVGEKHLIQAKTTLQIDFPKLLNASEVRLYGEKSGKPVRLLEAPLNNGGTSSVTFPLSEADGTFYLAAMDPSFRENPAGVAAASRSSLQTGSGPVSPQVSSGSSGLSPGAGNGSGAGPQDSAPAKKSALPSSAGSSGKDRYRTDPTPAGKPKPIEPQDAKQNTRKAFYCTLSIDCKSILSNRNRLNQDKMSVLPPDGVIFKSQKVVFYEGESVFDILLRETKKNKIQMEYKSTPVYNSGYIEGIQNIYEFDCGSLSGWSYEVNGWYPNYGCSRYLLKDGDVVKWRYTCDLGRDVGCDRSISQK